MAFIVAGGTIATEVLRRETRSGVLAVFRLESSQPRGGRLWIDVEAWGHLAGILARHGEPGRAVIAAGRLTQKVWSTPTGTVHQRLVITAADIELLGSDWPVDSPGLENTVTASGVVSTEPTSQLRGQAIVTTFKLAAGRAGSKTGRAWMPVEQWTRGEDCPVHRGEPVGVRGRLSYRSVTADETDGGRGGFVIKAREVLILAPRSTPGRIDRSADKD